MKEVTIDGVTYTQKCTNKFCTETPVDHIKGTITLNNSPIANLKKNMKEVTIEAVESEIKGDCQGCCFLDELKCTLPKAFHKKIVICGKGYIYKIKEK